MATAYVDQITGNGETVAYKAPCRVATTSNIVLSGLLTVDGVTVAANDRVLVKNQADQKQNGIYIANTGLWVRARDFDSNRDVTKGTRLTVTDGSTLAGREYVLTSANPVNVGTSNIIVTESLSSDSGSNAAAAAASAAAALVSQQSAHDDAVTTAADRVQTGLDRVATGADRVQTGLDAAATAADRVRTGQDSGATGADRTQTGLDAAATAADRVATGLDSASASASATLAGKWASEVEDTPVTTGKYSAFHWAQKAAALVLGGFSAAIHAATGKTTPASADEFAIADSAASWGLKKLTFANLTTAVLGQRFRFAVFGTALADTNVYLDTGFYSVSPTTANNPLGTYGYGLIINWDATGRRSEWIFSLTALTGYERRVSSTPNPPTTPWPAYTAFSSFTAAWQALVSGAIQKATTAKVTVGYTAGVYDLGTIAASGSVKPDPANGSYQKMTDNGALTFNAPDAADCYDIEVDITMGASAGAITFSGFPSGFPDGAGLVLTSGLKYKLFINKTDAGAIATLVALP